MKSSRQIPRQHGESDDDDDDAAQEYLFSRGTSRLKRLFIHKF